jgi:hypothetical protein
MARLLIASVSLLLALLMGAASVAASPFKSGFGPGIESFPSYEGQEICSPTAKPGVLAFRKVVLAAYPGTGVGGIERACHIGGRSEHKEGRAWDWTVNVNVPYQRAAAESLIDWLTSEDRFGNGNAMARRVGIMYLIWNRKIWFPGGGWQTYCVQKAFGCHVPGDRKSLRHPHTDHVHFSFTWSGARKQTTYWKKRRSFLTGAAASPAAAGQWVVSGNGAVAALRLPHLGSDTQKVRRPPVVGAAATATGKGYWLVYRNGRVSAFGDARHRGGAKGSMRRVAGITASPTGKGYWIFGKDGGVLAFGGVGAHGYLEASDETVSGMASTSTGLGYWLVTSSGKVTAFGDARARGSSSTREVTDIAATPTGLGYWLVTSGGKVEAFGDASHFGDLADKNLSQPFVGIERTPDGHGYWLVGVKGKVKPFGTAPRLASQRSYSAMVRIPSGLVPNLFPAD